jgi:hypothetical protein
MIQELSDLRASILEGRYADALTLLEQLDGMSRQAKLDAIESFLVRMLIHIIKNQLEQRLTNSWVASIRGSLVEIKKLNLQDNRTTYYVKHDEWLPMLEDALELAISDASVEVFNGAYTPFQVAEMVDRTQVIQVAQSLLNLIYTHSKKELPAAVNDYLTQLPGGEDWKEGTQR